MSEIAGWPGYDASEYELRFGEPVPFNASQRHFRAGYIDLAWLQCTSETMSWRNDNPKNIAHFALRACLSDELNFKYRQELETYYASRELERREREGITSAVEPIILAPVTFHRFPLDVRHATEVKDDGTGMLQPMTQIEYFDSKGGVTQDVLEYDQWMVSARSLSDYYWQFLGNTGSVASTDGVQAFVDEHYFGPDEEALLRAVVCQSDIR